MLEMMLPLISMVHQVTILFLRLVSNPIKCIFTAKMLVEL